MVSELDIWLPLDTNKKLYMGSPTTALDLTLDYLEKSKSTVIQIKKALPLVKQWY